MTATSIEAKIVEGLCDYFENNVTLPAGMGVAYPNVAFTPDGTNPYVRLTIAKNTPVTHRLGGGKEPERMGIFQATIYWPIGVGLVAPSEVANTIRNAFAYNTTIDHAGIRIRVTQEPAVRGDLPDGAYTQIPVVIPWSVYP